MTSKWLLNILLQLMIDDQRPPMLTQIIGFATAIWCCSMYIMPVCNIFVDRMSVWYKFWRSCKWLGLFFFLFFFWRFINTPKKTHFRVRYTPFFLFFCFLFLEFLQTTWFPFSPPLLGLFTNILKKKTLFLSMLYDFFLFFF